MLRYLPEGPTAGSCATALAAVIAEQRERGGRRPIFAHVFPFSAHHYELRMWLASADIDPDNDVQLCVVPPSQMVSELESGRIDGYCVGEPWNEVALQRGVGVAVASKHEIWNNSPEKVLGVTRDWAQEHPNTHRAMVAAMIEAARWLDVEENRHEAANLLVSEHMLDAPAASIFASLRLRTGGIVFHRGAATYPWRSHAVWFILQMLRWKQCWLAPNFSDIAFDVYRCETYREAASLVGEPCPRADYKSEGARFIGSTTPSTDGGSIMLGSDAMLDGSVFNAADPLGWLRLQRHGLPTVGYDSLLSANARHS